MGRESAPLARRTDPLSQPLDGTTATDDDADTYACVLAPNAFMGYARRVFSRIMIAVACGSLVVGCVDAPGGSVASTTHALVAPPCTDAERNAALDPNESSRYLLTCSLELSTTDVITRPLWLEGSAANGVSIDCGGATLDGSKLPPGQDIIRILSAESKDEAGGAVWDPPHDITVRGCNIIGSIRVLGMGENGEAEALKESSRSPGHTGRVREAAPHAITFEEVYVEGIDRIPLYLAPGVSRFSLVGSEIAGTSASTAIYLDAESTGNRIVGNRIHTDTARELIAIDGSQYNEIVSNTFSSLEDGGIYLYRNCGEGGVIRHAAPQHNRIINNVFYYHTYGGSNPSVFLGARNGNRPYCGLDAGWAFGSSASDRDWAQHNVVAQNQVYVRELGEMIREGDPAFDNDNLITDNETVSTHTHRATGCYVPWAYRDHFYWDGEIIDLVPDPRDLAPSCTSTPYVCRNGELMAETAPPPCHVETHHFECRVTGDNAGCWDYAVCPAGTRVIGARGVCNLEWGAVSDAERDAARPNTVSVTRPSAHVDHGLCNLGELQTSESEISWDGPADYWTWFGCQEHDANGGDCHARATIYCR